MSNVSNETEKDLFEIFVDQQDKLVFPTLAYSNLTSSDELCKIAGTILSAYADYYGCTANYNPQNGQLTLCAHFAQIENQEEGKVYAFEPTGAIKGNGSESGLRRIQQFENTVSNGNKFSITDAGKSGLAKFMSGATKNEKGEVKWNALGVLTQYFDPAPFGQQGVTTNVVNNISPIAIFRELYGDKAKALAGVDDNGSAIIEDVDVEYEIVVLRSLAQPGYNGMQTNPSEGPFSIDIRQISKKRLQESAKEIGVNCAFGKKIIR